MNERRIAGLELGRSEEAYRSLAEALPLIVWLANAAGDVDYVNGRWLEYTGMTLEQTYGCDWQSAIHPDDLSNCIAQWQAAIAHGTPYEIEQRLKCDRDGSYRWHLSRALPVRDAAGTIAKWLGTATDIDDARRALETSRQLSQQLQFIIEATDRFADSLDVEPSLDTLCKLIAGRFADWVCVYVIDPDGRLRVGAIQHADPARAETVARLRGSYAVDLDADGGVTRVINTRTPVILQDDSFETFAGAIHEDKRELGTRLEASSTICVPLLVRGRIVAVMNAVWSQSGRRYDATEIPFFEELAKRAAVAFDEELRHGRARANEEITRRIMESSDDCIALLDLDGLVVKANERGSARFARGHADLTPGSSWLDCWRPQDRAAACSAAASARSGFAGKFQGALAGMSADLQWWDISVTPVYDGAGLPIQLLAISRDVTGQKRHEAALSASEARYRAIANAIPQIAFTAGIDGTLDFVNDRWVAYTGLSLAASADYAGGYATHPDDRKVSAAKWFDALHSGDAFETECRLRRAADGVYRWHLMRAVPIRSGDGTIVQWFGTGTDIDDQKRVESEIARARDEALHAASMKSQFVAMMSHEIRTPISGVIGMTELLLLTPLSEEQREYAKVVSDSGQSLLRVINDILDFSKIDAGKLALESVEFELPSQFKSITDLLSTQADTKHVSVHSSIDPQVPNSLIGDPGRLRQILMNLVGNAVKFTSAGGSVRVAATVAAIDGANASLRFTVADSGIGIAPDVVTRLFEPFSQADGSTTRRFGGTGLGLSISKQLVTLMGGTIGVQSVLGAGSTFWFVVPFQAGRGQRALAAAAAYSARERRAQSRARRPERVLLVEDNDVNGLLAFQQFKHFGLEPTMVNNGREAVEAVRHLRYDVIFMDCHMPEMDGFEATRQIRRLELATDTRLPIIAMTADAQIEDRQACLAAGMDDYLSKPSSLASLSTILQRWLPESGPAKGNAVAR